jgi:uncharacterized membrane protein
MAHPLHPAIVHFPIACWTMSTLGDIASIWWGEPAWRISGILLIIGTAIAIAAMATGLLELRKINGAEQASRTAEIHMQFVLAAWMLYGLSLLLRWMGNGNGAPSTVSIVLSALGLVTLATAGWYGGKLVYEHGIGRVETQES